MTDAIKLLALLALLLPAAAPSYAQEAHYLFVGNSYAFFNAPDDLPASVQQLATNTVLDGSKVSATMVAKGGYRLTQHLADATGTTNTPLRQALVTGDAPLDVLFLQEQSQVPGFSPPQPDWLLARDAVVALADLATAKTAETFLVMTWGRRDGDSQNIHIFPDFQSMQALLAQGYVAFADAAAIADRPVYVTPCGLAFEQVFLDDLADGVVLPGFDGRFGTLYASDGSHPAPPGTFLCAAVTVAAVTGMEPGGSWAPTSVAADAAYLRGVARRVVLDDPFEPYTFTAGPQPRYPWVWSFSDWVGAHPGAAIAGAARRPLVVVDGSQATAPRVQVGGQDGPGRLAIRAAGGLATDELIVADNGVLRFQLNTLPESASVQVATASLQGVVRVEVASQPQYDTDVPLVLATTALDVADMTPQLPAGATLHAVADAAGTLLVVRLTGTDGPAPVDEGPALEPGPELTPEVGPEVGPEPVVEPPPEPTPGPEPQPEPEPAPEAAPDAAAPGPEPEPATDTGPAAQADLAPTPTVASSPEPTESATNDEGCAGAPTAPAWPLWFALLGLLAAAAAIRRPPARLPPTRHRAAAPGTRATPGESRPDRTPGHRRRTAPPGRPRRRRTLRHGGTASSPP